VNNEPLCSNLKSVPVSFLGLCTILFPHAEFSHRVMFWIVRIFIALVMHGQLWKKDAVFSIGGSIKMYADFVDICRE